MVKVRVTKEEEATVPAETVTRELERDAAPGVTVMVGNVLVIALPPMVALMVVGVPETWPVKVAV